MVKEGDKYKAVIVIEKVKNGQPTVISIGNRRFVWDPSGSFIKKKGRDK